MEWKPYSNPAFIPPSYTNMEVSPDGKIWIGKYRRNSQSNSLRAGYVNNISQLCLDYSVGPTLSSYIDLLNKVKTILDARPPDRDPFLGLPPKTNGVPYYDDNFFLTRMEKSLEEAKKATRGEKKKYGRKPPKGIVLTQETVSGQPLRRGEEEEEDDKLSKKGTGLSTLQFQLEQKTNGAEITEDEIQQEDIRGEEPEEEEKEMKALPMSEDDFYALLGMVAVSNATKTRSRVDYDIRISVLKPKPGDKGSPVFRIDFGAYFTVNSPSFKEMMAGSGVINGKKEELLFFDNPYFVDSNKKITGVKNGKMPRNFSSAPLVQSIVDDLGLNVSSLAGSNTSFKFDLLPIKVPKMPDTTFVLTNMRRESSNPSKPSPTNQ